MKIQKLKDIVESIPDFNQTISLTNIDDIFCKLRETGIKSVRVSFREMHMIAMYMVANAGNKKIDESLNWDAIKIMQDGLTDKFYGVRVILEDLQKNNA